MSAMGKVGVGLMENPSLMKRGDYYYWYVIVRHRNWMPTTLLISAVLVFIIIYNLF